MKTKKPFFEQWPIPTGTKVEYGDVIYQYTSGYWTEDLLVHLESRERGVKVGYQRVINNKLFEACRVEGMGPFQKDRIYWRQYENRA